MAATFVRPLRLRFHLLAQQHFLSSHSFSDTSTIPLFQCQPHHYFKPFSTATKNQKLNIVNVAGALVPPSVVQEKGAYKGSDSDDLDEGRGKNKKKRSARKAVKWGMELANFTESQIKRILRVADIEIEVFEALMLIKRLGPDVREGKRRQFSYIGRLLRDVEPDLMDALIQAMKDGDESRLQALSSIQARISLEDGEEEELEESELEEEDEGSNYYTDIATRWFKGLIGKDSIISNEVYALHNVDFDRQELRKLVRNVHSFQNHQSNDEESKEDVNLTDAKKSLTSFLESLAKQQIDPE